MRAMGVVYAVRQTSGVPPLRERMAGAVMRQTVLVLLILKSPWNPPVFAGFRSSQVGNIVIIQLQSDSYVCWKTDFYQING